MWGERVRAARLGAGLTIREFGPLFGISSGSVCRWESGENPPPADQKVAIARWAKQDPDRMFSLKAGN